ncbi:MAG TPA: alpha/beta hydrolase [Deferrisomatales bacterium]|nr:alpha/beta hydrolase [Deferrisomatales bacterium]
MNPTERTLDIGIRLHLRLWSGGGGVPFLLLHGLASNARTWDPVAQELHAAGHPVAALDQRGHGQSDKPAAGYDLATAAADAARVVGALGWERPILVGQSWGGTVVLQLAAQHPGLARAVGCVDGGYLDLHMLPDASWATVSRQLQPPDLLGTPHSRLEAMIRTHSPQWDAQGVAATLANFELLPDGTVRPWLSLERHMAIVRAMWELDTGALFRRVAAPVLLCVADQGRMSAEVRRRQVAAAEAGLRRCVVVRFADTDHDIHVHRPHLLAQTFLQHIEDGIWSDIP